jgi:putative phage-type endonuclease
VKILNLIQGTPDWHQHRATHFNASDAPAMLGVSPYKTRDQLIREKATGVAPDIDPSTQRRFDDGHRYEALARPIAERIIGEDLFPCVGEDGNLSASFDGLTILGDVAFEHKSLNDDLRATFAEIDTMAPEYREGISAGDHLAEHYRVQMEQQCMVSGAERVLFIASKWSGDDLVEERHCWYGTDATLRARIIAGWDQFEDDVSAYQHVEVSAPAAVGRAPEQLPTLRVEVTGMVTASNLAEFRANARTVLSKINRDLQTDEDFANADQAVKWCKGVEERLELTKQQVLSQTADIEAVFRTMDEVAEETRQVRLDLDRLVKAEKERRRGEIVADGVGAVRSHYDSINATLGQHAIQVPAGLQSIIGEAIKGKKTLTSIREAANGAAANAKISASQVAERVRGNVAVLAEYPDHAHLFADRVQLCASKEPADLRNLALARIAELREKEDRQRESDRERIRQEEVDKLAREAEAVAAASAPPAPVDPIVETAASDHPESFNHSEPKAIESPAPFDVFAPKATQSTRATVKLGDINARIAPLSITAEGLSSLGFTPVGTDRAAKLYSVVDLPAIYRAMWRVIEGAAAPARKVG